MTNPNVTSAIPLRCIPYLRVTSTPPLSGKPALMASVGADKLLKVWDIAPFVDTPASAAATPSPPAALRVTAAVVAHDKDINTVAVAPNDSLIATGSQDKTAKVCLGGQDVPLSLK